MRERPVGRLRRAAAARLAAAGIDSALLDATVLLAYLLNDNPTNLVLAPDRPVDPDVADRFERLVARREAREPVAYLTGIKEFWSISLRVTADVLVPRPETETTVETAVAAVRRTGASRVIDVGTGSGAIALALAGEIPGGSIVAADASAAAARVAGRNARRLGLERGVAVVRTDGVEALTVEDAVVVANLPYIPSAAIDRLEPEIARWEPRIALDGGADGLDAFRWLFAQLRADPPVAAVLEIGDGQLAAVTNLAAAAGFGVGAVGADLAGRPRAIEFGPRTRSEPHC